MLRGGHTWTGPWGVLVVDDYDMLIGPAGSPLGPLVELLPLAGDIGLAVLLARRTSGAARSGFEPFGARLRELASPGLLLSGDPSEGPLLDGQAARPQPPGQDSPIAEARWRLETDQGRVIGTRSTLRGVGACDGTVLSLRNREVAGVSAGEPTVEREVAG